MRRAIIDIGCNAIRAQGYDSDKRGALEIFSDTFKSDILSLLQQNDISLPHQTYLIFQYLTDIFASLEIYDIRCIATAVLRGRPNSEQFIKKIKKDFNIDIEIISGEYEAYLGALGIIAGIKSASGVVVDLGGGSLEIAEIFDNKVGKVKSIPIGTKTIAQDIMKHVTMLKNILSDEFGIARKYDNLYLIGGAFRFIGKCYMDFKHDRLKILHNFEVQAQDFRFFLDRITSLNSSTKLSHLYKNVDCNAALILSVIIDAFVFSGIVVSNYGLKEGLVFQLLTQEEKQKDVVFEQIKNIVGFDSQKCDFKVYIDLIAPALVVSTSMVEDVIKFSIMLLTFDQNIDRTLKSNFMESMILHTNIPLGQVERLMLSVIFSVFYNSKVTKEIHSLVTSKLSKELYYTSHIIGNFLKITKRIDGPIFKAPSFHLEYEDKYIKVKMNKILPKVVFEDVRRCLKAIFSIRQYKFIKE